MNNNGKFKLLSLYSMKSKDGKTFYFADIYVEEFHITNKVFITEVLFNDLKLNLDKYKNDISGRVCFSYNHKISAYNLIIR